MAISSNFSTRKIPQDEIERIHKRNPLIPKDIECEVNFTFNGTVRVHYVTYAVAQSFEMVYRLAQKEKQREILLSLGVSH